MIKLTHPGTREPFADLTDEQAEALSKFAERYSASGDWKQRLIDYWMNGRDASEPLGHALRQVRNQFGPSWLIDCYAALWRASLPAYEAPQWVRDEQGRTKGVANESAIKWSGEAPPPAIGARADGRGFGGIVTGYFVEGGWLGIIVHCDTRPEWHKTDTGRSALVHLFGADL